VQAFPAERLILVKAKSALHCLRGIDEGIDCGS